MNPDIFFENFELLADAPNGIQKLRELILQLAVMGKLVEQDSSDEPAPFLLERIKAEKKRLSKERKLKKEESLPLIESKDVPFEIPKTWKWVYFKDIGQIVGGGTPATNQPEYFSDNGIPWLTPADLYNLKEKFVVKGRRDLSELGLQKSSAQLMPAGTVLFSSRAPIGYVAIAAVDLATNQGFKSCVPFIKEMNEYIYYFLKFAGKEIDQNASGTTFKEVSGKVMSQVLFSLPPLIEQRRIVSKVNELLTFCDKLEAHRQKKQELQSKINSAALDRMLSAENKEEFEHYWQQICDNFDLLYDNPENVEKLRQAILQLAIQGKLVEQNPEDEPANVLIEKIKDWKENLVKDGEINEIKVSRPLERSEIHYQLPQGWIWCRWNDVSMKIGDLDHKMPLECEEGIPYVSPKDFYGKNEINFTTAKKISREDFEKLSQKIQPEKNDIIFPRYGTIGENRFVVTDNEFLASYSCAVIKSMNGLMEPKYSYYYSLSPLVKSEIIRYINKTTQPNVGLKSIQVFVYPLPPLAEQKRIVEKVEQLMGLCDELEAKLRKEREDSQKLLEAVVRGLLEGAVAGKSESDKNVPMQAAVIQSK